MSMDINVYFPSALTTDSLPSIIQRLGELGLRCEFLEDFSFQDTVPITLYLAIGAKEYQEQCFETGFEIALSKFDYAKEVHAVQHPPKQGLLNKWLVGDQQEPPRKFIATREIDKVLEQCRYELSINYSKDILTPFAFAAVTAEVADGIVLECESGEYLKPQEAIQQIPELAKDWSPLE